MFGLGLITLAILATQVADGEIRRRGHSISNADSPVLFWIEVAFLGLVTLGLIYGGLIGSGSSRNSNNVPPSE
jgi:hypothetical protein